MGHAWDSSETVTVRDVLELLQRNRRIAYTTVMTVMDHLHSKRLLDRTRSGRAYAYRPAQGREAYEAGLMDEVLSSSRDRSATLLHFVERISGEELRELKSVIAELEKGEVQ